MTRRDFEAQLILKAWKDDAFRRALLSDPKTVFEKEVGVTLPAGTEVRVLEETPCLLYVVLPAPPTVGGALRLTYPDVGSTPPAKRRLAKVKKAEAPPH